MLILNHQEVIYCHVVRPNLGKLNKLPGLEYSERLFCQIESYPIAEYKTAVNRARQIFDEAEQRFIFLVVEEPNGYSIWREDSQLISVKDFESKLASKKEISLKKNSTNLVETIYQQASGSRIILPVNQGLSEALCG